AIASSIIASAFSRGMSANGSRSDLRIWKAGTGHLLATWTSCWTPTSSPAPSRACRPIPTRCPAGRPSRQNTRRPRRWTRDAGEASGEVVDLRESVQVRDAPAVDNLGAESDLVVALEVAAAVGVAVADDL